MFLRHMALHCGMNSSKIFDSKHQNNCDIPFCCHVHACECICVHTHAKGCKKQLKCKKSTPKTTPKVYKKNAENNNSTVCFQVTWARIMVGTSEEFIVRIAAEQRTSFRTKKLCPL